MCVQSCFRLKLFSKTRHSLDKASQPPLPCRLLLYVPTYVPTHPPQKAPALTRYRFLPDEYAAQGTHVRLHVLGTALISNLRAFSV